MVKTFLTLIIWVSATKQFFRKEKNGEAVSFKGTRRTWMKTRECNVPNGPLLVCTVCTPCVDPKNLGTEHSVRNRNVLGSEQEEQNFFFHDGTGDSQTGFLQAFSRKNRSDSNPCNHPPLLQ